MHPPAHKIHGVWMECVIYGNRRFHIFLTPEKVTEYDQKYPHVSDFGSNSYLNYQIYTKEKLNMQKLCFSFLDKAKNI